MEPQETLSLMHARKSYLRLGWSLVVLEVGAQIGAVLIALLGAVLASAGHDVSGTCRCCFPQRRFSSCC